MVERIIFISVIAVMIIIFILLYARTTRRFKNALKLNEHKLSTLKEKDDTIAALNADIDTLNKAVATEKDNAHALGETLSAEINKLKEDNSNLAARLAGVTETLDIKNSENKLLSERYNELQDQFTSAIDEANNNIETANNTIIELSNEIEALKGKEQTITEDKSTRRKSYIKELKAKKRSELFALAKEYNLKGYSRLTNEALIEKINNAYKKSKRKK